MRNLKIGGANLSRFDYTYDSERAGERGRIAINYLDTGKRSEFTYDGANRRVKIVERGAGQTAVAQPGDVTYSDYSSAPFTAPAGSYTISFEGLSPTNYIAVIDAVKLNNVFAPNGSFETPVVGPEAVVNPAGGTWTFEGEAGIAGNGSGLTEVDAPHGVQVGFIQGEGVIRQTVTLAAGNYTLAFKAAQSSLNKGVQQLRVTIEKTGLPMSVQRFVFSGNTIAEERDSTGATVTKRFFAEGEWRLNSKGDGKYYYTRDHLGSIREVTNSSGVLQARYDYDLWGNSVVVNGTMSLDFGYTGHYFHAPSGLNLTLYRAYSPALGRWLNRDPIGERGGLNLYGYVENNPTNMVDPLGRNPIAIGAGIGTFIEPGGGTIIGAGIGAVVTIIIGAAVYDHVHNGDIQLSASFPPGYWPGDTGAEEWGRRNGVNPREARRRFHRIKKGCPESQAPDDYGVNPETGDVIDPEGENAGNLDPNAG